MKQIIIENTKSIRYLEFNIPEKPDVYLLVGANGAGKSTLLVCLQRLCNNLAFSQAFYTTRGMKHLDQYSRASITYKSGDSTIQFRKAPARWVATPRKGNQQILDKFGYSEVIFIKADSKRIEATQADIKAGEYIKANSSMIRTLNEIFETERFNNLSRLRNSNGRGRQATYFYVIEDRDERYSEKRFSSGEMAIIRLVEKLINVQSNALILLDEAEMALHPRIQKNLFEYIKYKSKEKNLTAFVATHSTTLINMGSKDNIILLETKENGASEVLHPCYPAKAIGSVDYIDSSGFDYIFFVEDEMARMLLKKMKDQFLKINQQHSTASVCIVPVGGYAETALLAVNTRKQLFSEIKVFAFLDADAFTEGKENKRFWEIYQNNSEIIKSLNCTPEIWIVEQIESLEGKVAEMLRDIFRVEKKDILENAKYKKCTGDNPRKIAKNKLRVVIDIIKKSTGDNENILIDQLTTTLVNNIPGGEIMKTMAPVLKSTRI